MRHDGTPAFADALPDAPLEMPRQALEPPRLLDVLRRLIPRRSSRH